MLLGNCVRRVSACISFNKPQSQLNLKKFFVSKMAQTTVSVVPDKWWQRGSIYQVYPRSFMDGNGDGIGDLQGVKQRLQHLVDLGVAAFWLSPIYPSPMADFGYDVSDYNDVDPMFGTLKDFDELTEAAHALGLKVLLDLVPCHTSDQHPWFKDSRSSKTSAHRDWYYWRDPAADGGPPNNWRSFFGGSAWELDKTTGQYYLRSFVKEQPDLNWHNPAVEEAIFNTLRFWMRRGVDGFRVDVMHGLFKSKTFHDEPPNPLWKEGMNEHDSLKHIYTLNQPETFAAVVRMRKVLEEVSPDLVLIGEIWGSSEDIMRYYGPNLDGAHMPFNFSLIHAKWTPPIVRKIVDKYEAVLPPGAWPNWCLGNHDVKRISTRVGADQARVANMLLLTLRGTPTIYYGDEIGMENGIIPVDKIQDPFGKTKPESGRDPARIPMQWSADAHAGFSSVEPWLPVAANYKMVNVKAQEADPKSFLSFFKTLIKIRKTSDALIYGKYIPVTLPNDPAVFAYVRVAENIKEHPSYLIALNMTAKQQRLLCQLPPVLAKPNRKVTTVLSTFMDHVSEPVDLTSLVLRPNEGLLVFFPPTETLKSVL